MLPLLNSTQQQAIAEHGTPLPLFDEATHNTYILLSAEIVTDPHNGVTARIPGIAAYGEGDTEQEAALALCEALRGYLDAFAER